jgi:glycosyltransferase involved in cell wall biosynthesis
MTSPLLQLSVIVPVKDEEAAIGPSSTAVGPILDGCSPTAPGRILFIDDWQRGFDARGDHGAHRRERRVRALSLSRNFGKEAALSAGLTMPAAKAVVPMDVDLQDPPEVLGRCSPSGARAMRSSTGVRATEAPTPARSASTADLILSAH